MEDSIIGGTMWHPFKLYSVSLLVWSHSGSKAGIGKRSKSGMGLGLDPESGGSLS